MGCPDSLIPTDVATPDIPSSSNCSTTGPANRGIKPSKLVSALIGEPRNRSDPSSWRGRKSQAQSIAALGMGLRDAVGSIQKYQAGAVERQQESQVIVRRMDRRHAGFVT